jgi:hypothetical protein
MQKIKTIMTRFYLYLISSESKQLFVASILIMVITASGFLIFDGYSNGSESSANAHFSLQKSKNAQEFGAIIEDWVPDKVMDFDSDLVRRIRGYFRSLLIFDYLFPVSYGLFGMFLIARTSHRLQPLPSIWLLGAFCIPFLATIFDILENSFHIYILLNIKTMGDLGKLSDNLVTNAHTFSMLKFLFLGLTLFCVLLIKVMALTKRVKS